MLNNYKIMDKNIEYTHNRIKWIIWDDKILNHYINNFSQHIYFEDVRRKRNILYKYLLNVFETLKTQKTKQSLYFYLRENYKNKNFLAENVIKGYYN